MSKLTLKDISSKMADIDFCMLSTKGSAGQIASRPMSNNGDVEYDGDSWFFAYENSAKIRELEADPRVSLTFAAGKGLLGKPGIFIAVEGEATLSRDKSEFEAHWAKDLDIWFPEGIDTPGVVLIKVHAKEVEYWDGTDNEKVAL